jgi:cob(I)alamin adenosyltransferase
VSIATGFGDSGKTSLPVLGTVSKDHPLVECIGALDELSSFLALASVQSSRNETKQLIKSVQTALSALMGCLATGILSLAGRSDTLQVMTRNLDKAIKEIESSLSLDGFAPSPATAAGAFLDASRTVCRRAERRLISAAQGNLIPEEAFVYLNRLSDLLYLLSRQEER